MYIFTITSAVLLYNLINTYSAEEWSESSFEVCKAYIFYPHNILVYFKNYQHWQNVGRYVKLLTILFTCPLNHGVQYGCSEADTFLLQTDSTRTCEIYSNQTLCGSLWMWYITKEAAWRTGPLWRLVTGRISGSKKATRVALCQTKVCTGVMERVGEPACSEEDEAERLVTSRCNSSTLFCSSARFANSSL